MSQEQFELRKVHYEGSEKTTMGMSIPIRFLRELDLKQGNYVKMWLDDGGKRIWIEKLQEK